MATTTQAALAFQGATGTIPETTAIGMYLTYAAIAVGLVMYLARILSKNGSLFLRGVFEDDEMAQAVNKLLVVGFYLLNLGYALMIYRLEASYQTLTLAFNELVVRLGILLLSLGVIHLFNMFVFWKIRGAATKPNATQMLQERLARAAGPVVDPTRNPPAPNPPAQPTIA